MKIIRISIILFLLVSNSFSQESVPEEVVEKLVGAYFLNSHNELRLYMDANSNLLTYNDIKNYIDFNGKMTTSLKNTQFFHYDYLGYEPNIGATIYKNAGKYHLLQFDYHSDSILVSPKSEHIINKLLGWEMTELSPKRLIRFIKFIFLAKRSFNKNSLLILNNWSDIPHDDDWPISYRIKRMVKPIDIDIEKDGTIFSFYAWDSVSNFLHKVKMIYKNRKVSFFSRVVGKCGIEGIII